jgi:hypothetical protein
MLCSFLDPSAQLGLAGSSTDPSHWGYNSTYASYAGFNSSAALAHYGSASAVASAVAAVAATGANGSDSQGLNSADPNAQIPTGNFYFRFRSTGSEAVLK